MLTEVTISQRAAQTITPGEPFRAVWEITHHGTVDLPGASFAVRGRGISVVATSLDDAALDPRLIGSIPGGVVVQVPTIRPNQRLTIAAWVVATLPVDDPPTLGYEYIQGGMRQSEETPLLIERPSVKLGGDLVLLDSAPICAGESRRGYIRLHNASGQVLTELTVSCETNLGHVADLGATPDMLKPGEFIDVQFQIHFESLDDEEVTISATAIANDAAWEAHDSLEVVSPPSLAASRLSLLNEMALAPAGGILAISLELVNTGERPAVNPAVRFDVPPGVDLLDGTLVLPTIEPGEPRSFTYSFRVPPVTTLAIGASVNGEHLAALDVPIQQIASLHITHFEVPEEVNADEPFAVTAQVEANGNVALVRATIALAESTHFQYIEGTLMINDASVPDTAFSREHRIGLKNIQPGAAVRASWQMKAPHPTIASPGALSLSVRWGDDSERRLSSRMIMVRPSILGSPLFELDDDVWAARPAIPVVTLREQQQDLQPGVGESAQPTHELGAVVPDSPKIPPVAAVEIPEGPVTFFVEQSHDQEDLTHGADESVVIHAVQPVLETTEVAASTPLFEHQRYAAREDVPSTGTTPPEPPQMLETGLVPSVTEEHAADVIREVQALIQSTSANERVVGVILSLPPPGNGASSRYRVLYDGLSALAQDAMGTAFDLQPLTSEQLQSAYEIAEVESAEEFVDLLRPVIARHFPMRFRDQLLSDLTLAA